jgi:hypothetical protein
MDQSGRISVDFEPRIGEERHVQSIKLLQSGNDAALPLPDEWLQRMGVKLGDTIWATITPEGIELTARKPTLPKRTRLQSE